MTIYTRPLVAGESFTPTAAMNILYLSYQVSTGTGDNATLLGSAPSPEDGSASQPVTVPAGGGDVFVDRETKPVQGMTITCNQGEVSLRIGY